EDATPMDAISKETLAEKLQPALSALPNLPRMELNDGQLAEIRHGRPIRKPRPLGAAPGKLPSAEVEPRVEWAGIDAAGKLVALLAEKKGGELWPARNFEG